MKPVNVTRRVNLRPITPDHALPGLRGADMRTADSRRGDRSRPPFGLSPANARGSERGASVLVILALLACMALLVAANAESLAHLKQELRLIDRQQQQRYGPGPGH